MKTKKGIQKRKREKQKFSKGKELQAKPSPTPEEIYNNTSGPVIPASDDNGINKTIIIPGKLIEKVKKKINPFTAQFEE